MKPISASQALRGRQLLPTKNRFEVLRDATKDPWAPSGGLRPPPSRDNSASSASSRSDSVKRKANESPERSAQPTKRRYQGSSNGILEGQSIQLLQATDGLKLILDQVTATISKSKWDPELESILLGMRDFMAASAKIHEEILKTVMVNGKSVTRPQPQPLPQVTIADCTDNSDSETETGAISYSQMASRRPTRYTVRKTAPPVEHPPVDPKVKAFSEAVKAAERSTLVFNLDMGIQKTLNEKTILEKATLALTSAAALVEGNQAHRPSAEAVEALDDVLSIAKSVSLFGRTTKPYRNMSKKEDVRNGRFCTIPVKYDFKNKDSRIEAESVLRSRCKFSALHPILRF